jgi:hypothetical protein
MFVLKLFPMDDKGKRQPTVFLWVDKTKTGFERFQYKDNSTEASGFLNKGDLISIATWLMTDYWFDERESPVWAGFEVITSTASNIITGEESMEYITYLRKLKMGPCAEQALGTMLNRPHGSN